VPWREGDQRQLLIEANTALDRLTNLVTNLLDLSRLQAGVLSVTPRPVGLEDIVSRALAPVTDRGRVELDVSAELPEVTADPTSKEYRSGSRFLVR
jgi:two-component system sensor histidine kinase KdpD